MRDWAGWTISGVVTAALFAGGAAAALRQPPGVTEGAEPVAVAMDLSVGLVAAPPPAVAAADLPTPPAPPPAPAAAAPKPVASADRAPVLALPKTLALADAPLSLPQMDKTAPPKPGPKPEPPAKKADPAPEQPKQAEKKAPAKEKPKKSAKAAAAAPTGGAAAPAKPAQARKEAGTANEASYAKAVLKKIAKLSRKAAPGKGRAVVGFVIAADGQLSRVVILTSSGIDALDKTALDHIRRAAPFAAPPQGVKASFSFEFVAK